MDTANDYRFIIAEDAVNRLRKIIVNWQLPYHIDKNKALKIVDEIKSRVMRMKYSFLPITLLLSMREFEEITNYSTELSKILLQNKPIGSKKSKYQLLISEIRYSLWILMGLKHRFRFGEQNLPEYAIDVIGAEIFLVQKHSSADKLWVLKCGTEKFSFTVVTNIPNIRKGEVRGVAILPPVEFMGIVSEAMIATDPLPKTFKGKIIPFNRINISDVRAKILNIVSRK
ncbi:tRNA-binding protein [Staphylothermus hellenicus]|uniref:T-RNA-binding domain protein n=1 Tax=Staphylothermus hellenicus (strain DSM 12710 / JCM 10830 / BK20S6-10-b1 / P8) TaxID=591019 RepID=D7DA80_STAHD|nr:tRNA-binding protein [Staphylothermus hellenicus]ADI32676.1 t-RNA-binding domain protein [Staphylothermus hellenicus DSM 12710]